MEDIKIYKKVNTISPVMIAGWPGMGNVALGAVEYLHKALDATRFAEIRMDNLAILDGMVVEDGFAKFPEPPRNTFYYVKDHDIIIFEGELQLQGQAGISLLEKVLDVASQFKVSRIYTGAAFPMPVSYKEGSEIYAVANSEAGRQVIAKAHLKRMEGGHISGLNGLMLGFAEKRGIDAICLLATMPQYAIGIPNPKASAAVIEALTKLLNFEIDLHELDSFIKEMEEKMSIIEEKVKDVFPAEDKHHEARPTEKKIPDYIMERIEKLFEEARLDKKKAIVLKKELDRWDLYKLYEDRFLDLFKEGQ